MMTQALVDTSKTLVDSIKIAPMSESCAGANTENVVAAATVPSADEEAEKIATNVMIAAESTVLSKLDALTDRVFHVPDHIVLPDDLINLKEHNTAKIEMELTEKLGEKLREYRQARFFLPKYFCWKI